VAHSHKEGGTEGFLGASFYELWELLCPLAYEWMLCVCVCVCGRRLATAAQSSIFNSYTMITTSAAPAIGIGAIGVPTGHRNFPRQSRVQIRVGSPG